MTDNNAGATRSPVKVAVLGGGAGGIAAAFWLTAPELEGRYQVTVYTPGWRLGGKCASGRNQALFDRIEEHGLHILMGCYRYAFDTLRNCYAEWKPRAGSPFRTWQDAFTPAWQVTLEAKATSGTPPAWAPWNFVFPELPGEPGDPLSTSGPQGLIFDADDVLPALEPHLVAAAHWLEDHITQHIPFELLSDVDHHDLLGKFRSALLTESSSEFAAEIAEKLKQLSAGIHDAVVTTLDSAKAMEATRTSPLPAGQADSATAAQTDTAGFICPLRCKLILAEIALGVAFGWTRDILVEGKSLDDLDALDFRQWLASCHVSADALAAAPMRALYDLTFGYRGGDATSLDHGSMAAGVTLRFVLEASLGYKHAPLWRMNAGMGDTVFTPLYQVLRARGATIKFFHRLEGLALTPDGARIGAIRLTEQARVTSGDYDPFIVVQGLDCWPSQPLWSQLADGAKLQAAGVDFERPAEPTLAARVDLELGRDFDVAVLAVPPDVIKGVASGLAGRNAAWDAMLAQSCSVSTEAFQLWLKPDLAGLGWSLGPTVLTGYAEPYDSWADMSHLLPREGWSGPDAPRAIGYFCGCLNETRGETRGTPDPKQDAQTWLAQSIATLWPAAVAGGTLDPRLVVSGYYRANYQGSERYVQTPAGSVRYRLASDAPVFGNLYLAGDWTLTRFSGGCFEAAIESGMRAAAAIVT